MDPIKPSSARQRGPKKKTESQPLGIKKKPLKVGKDATNSSEVKAKLEAMKKFSQAMAKPQSESSTASSEASLLGIVTKGANKYAEEVLKDALKKRFNEKFQLSNLKLNKQKATEFPKKLDSFDLTESQLEGLTKKFNLKIYISIGERVALASELGMTEHQVQTWFSIRRTKLKKNQELAELMTPVDLKSIAVSSKPTPIRKGKGGIKTVGAQPPSEDLQDDALFKTSEKENIKNPEVIDILDDEEDFSKKSSNKETNEVEDTPPVMKPPYASKRLRSDKKKSIESIDDYVERDSIITEPKFKAEAEKAMDDGKDKEIEVLRKEIKIILNDMVKKTIMEKEVEAWRLKYDSVTKAFKEKEQVVKNLEVKIPNMIEEFTKCVENKEYLFDLKENELKKAEASVTEKEIELKNYQSEVSRVNHERDQWKNEKNDFVVKVANLDVKSSKLSNELFKKEMEIKKFKEKEKENAVKLKQLALELVQKQESTAQIQESAEFSKLKARCESQANTIQNLTKTCEYQKSQITYLRNEVETRVEMLSQKEIDLRQVKDSVANNMKKVQANASQLLAKTETQHKIMEHQKTIISKFKNQTDEQAKQISKLDELQIKYTENSEQRNSLKQSLDKKSVQVKNLKKSIEAKNGEMGKFKSAQDQLFSQINDLEMKNFNKSEELKTLEVKYEYVAAIEKKSIKTVGIDAAAEEYMKIMKEKQKNKKSAEKCAAKEIQIITLDEETATDSAVVSEDTVGSSSDAQHTLSEEEKNGPVGERRKLESPLSSEDIVPLKFNFGGEAVPYVGELDEPEELDDTNNYSSEIFEKTQEGTVAEENTTCKPSAQLVPMLTYLWPLVSTEEEQHSSDPAGNVQSRPRVGRKLSRKLVKRADVDITQVPRESKLALKRHLQLDSGIPIKRRRLSSKCLENSNIFLPSTNLLLPRTLQPSYWEKLLRMKLVLSSSVFSKLDLPPTEFSNLAGSSPPLLNISYNWPMLPYTAVPCQSADKPAPLPSQTTMVVKTFDLLLSPNSLAITLHKQSDNLRQACKFGVKRRADTFESEVKAKRSKFDSSSPVWPLLPYKSGPILLSLVPTIKTFDLLYPRETILSTQVVWLGRKRPRCVEEEELPLPKKLKLCTPSSCWPIAIYNPVGMFNLTVPAQPPSITITSTLLSPPPDILLPILSVNFPLIKYTHFLSSIKSLSLPTPLIYSPEVSGITLLFPLSSGLCLDYPAPSTQSWPLVPYKPASKSPKRLETAPKKMKLKWEDKSALSGNYEMCQQLVVSEVLGSVSLVTQGKMKLSCEEDTALSTKYEICQRIVEDALEHVVWTEQDQKSSSGSDFPSTQDSATLSNIM